MRVFQTNRKSSSEKAYESRRESGSPPLAERATAEKSIPYGKLTAAGAGDRWGAMSQHANSRSADLPSKFKFQ